MLWLFNASNLKLLFGTTDKDNNNDNDENGDNDDNDYDGGESLRDTNNTSPNKILTFIFQ